MGFLVHKPEFPISGEFVTFFLHAFHHIYLEASSHCVLYIGERSIGIFTFCYLVFLEY